MGLELMRAESIAKLQKHWKCLDDTFTRDQFAAREESNGLTSEWWCRFNEEGKWNSAAIIPWETQGESWTAR